LPSFINSAPSSFVGSNTHESSTLRHPRDSAPLVASARTSRDRSKSRNASGAFVAFVALQAVDDDDDDDDVLNVVGARCRRPLLPDFEKDDDDDDDDDDPRRKERGFEETPATRRENIFGGVSRVTK
jgi:hypothetical protein